MCYINIYVTVFQLLTQTAFSKLLNMIITSEYQNKTRSTFGTKFTDLSTFSRMHITHLKCNNAKNVL